MLTAHQRFVQVPVAHGEDFAAVAAPQLAQALAGVGQAARAVHLSAMVASAAAFPGCVQLLLEVDLRPQKQQAAAEDVGSGLLPALEEAFRVKITAALQLLESQQHVVLLVEVVPALPAAGPAAAPCWNSWPCCALVNPVCLAAGQQGGASKPVHIGLLPGAAVHLPGQAQVVVTGHCLAGGGVISLCRVLPRAQLWSPAGPGPRRLLSVAALQEQEEAPAVLKLHVLDAAADVGSPSAAAHPLASLPLLCLPPAAAEEVLVAFAGMVQDVAEAAAGGAACDEAQAARQAYWQHYVPFVTCWRSLMLLAAAGSMAHDAPAAMAVAAAPSEEAIAMAPGAMEQEAVALLADQTRQLLAFLAAHGMAACLEVARGLVARAGQVVASGLMAEQPGLGASPAEAPATSTDMAAVQQAPSSSSKAGHQAVAAEAAAGSSALAASAAASPCAAAGLGAGTKADHTGTCRQGQAGERPAVAATGHLTWYHVLLGFPDAASEAAYLAFKNTVYLAQMDSWGLVICLAFMAAHLLPALHGWMHGRVSVMISHLPGIFNWPLVLMLLHRPLYQRYREALLLVVGGTGRVMFMLGNGALSLLLQRDTCTLLPKCGVIMPLLCMQWPLVQQVRFLPAAVTSLLDGTGMALYAAFRTGSWLCGLAAGVAGAAVGMLVSAWFELRCRAAYVRAQAAEPSAAGCLR